jgi:nucleoside-triphosphatase THEP1
MYEDRHSSKTSTIWIQGVAGSGKSNVAAHMIQALKREAVPVLFFFARRIIKSNSEPQHLVRDCLYQMLDHSTQLQSRLNRAMLQCGNANAAK